MTREAVNMAFDIAKLPTEAQDKFFQNLEATALFSAEELTATKVCVAYMRLLLYPELNATIKREMAYALYNEWRIEK